VGRRSINPKMVPKPFHFLSIFLLLIIPIQTFATEDVEGDHEDEAKLISTLDKISITHYISVFGPGEKLTISFNLKNVGDIHAEKIRVYPSALIMGEEAKFSTAPFYISEDKVSVIPIQKDEIDPGQSMQLTFTLDEIIFNEATYEGNVKIYGENFDPLTLDVKIIIKENSWELILFTLVGVSISTIVGYFYTKREKMKEYENKINETSAIISDINGHIRNINNFSNTIQQLAWKNIRIVYDIKQDAIVKHLKNLTLDKNAEAVKWFESMGVKIQNQYFQAPVVDQTVNHPLPEFTKPKIDDSNFKKIADKLREKKWKDDVKTKTKWIYFVVTMLAAMPATLFATDNFVGHPLLNLMIAASLGFTIYRAQDIPKAFKPSESKEEKTEEPPKDGHGGDDNDHGH